MQYLKYSTQLFLLMIFVPGFQTSDDDCPVNYDVLRDSQGVITSSPDYPRPDVGSGCRAWYIYGQPGGSVVLSFDDLDLPSSEATKCTQGKITLGPDPEVSLCGSLRHMNSSEKAYISNIDHVWIHYHYNEEQIGRGFKLTYISASGRCLPSQHSCPDGTCILNRWLCNGAEECKDGSDEVNCPTIVPPEPSTVVPYDCGGVHFGCIDRTDGEFRCFPNTKFCDDIPDCVDGKDEAHCDDTCEQFLEGPTGSFLSPSYPNSYPDNLDCTWHIHVNTSSQIKLQFVSFSLANDGDYVEVREGDKDGAVLARLDSSHPPFEVIHSTSNRMSVLLHTDNARSESGFNATFQKKGSCFESQLACGYGELDCYEDEERCDGVWDCPLHGGDERGCNQCPKDLFTCGPGTQCYKESEHCNGIVHCPNKNDEIGCSPLLCGPRNGTFLCHNMLCIYESWKCDGANDCGDGSDEINCPLSRKVVVAAVIGSLICALLLTIALGCTCQLHAMRVRDQNTRRRYRSPLSRLQEEMFANRQAPPNYNEAMVTSRSFEEARQDFLDQFQQAMAEGNLDLTSLVSQVTMPPRDRNHNEAGPATRIRRAQNQNRQTTPTSNTNNETVVPPQASVPRLERSRQASGESDTSDDSLLDVQEVLQADNVSDILVSLSLEAGVSAQFRRGGQPKGKSTSTTAESLESSQPADSQKNEDSASGSSLASSDDKQDVSKDLINHPLNSVSEISNTPESTNPCSDDQDHGHTNYAITMSDERTDVDETLGIELLCSDSVSDNGNPSIRVTDMGEDSGEQEVVDSEESLSPDTDSDTRPLIC